MYLNIKINENREEQEWKRKKEKRVNFRFT